MLSSIEAAFLALVFVVPGFLVRRGFLRARARGQAEVDLHALAEVMVWSLFVVATGWWWRGDDIVRWAVEGALLRDHATDAYWFLVTMIALSFPVGVTLGLLMDWLEERWDSYVRRLRPDENTKLARLVRRVESLGVTTAPTVWDETWDRLREASATYYVRIRLTSGDEIVGAFAGGSVVGRSPEPHQIYLSEVYRADENDQTWVRVPGTKGAFADASQIESIEFAESLDEWKLRSPRRE